MEPILEANQIVLGQLGVGHSRRPLGDRERRRPLVVDAMSFEDRRKTLVHVGDDVLQTDVRQGGV